MSLLLFRHGGRRADGELSPVALLPPSRFDLVVNGTGTPRTFASFFGRLGRVLRPSGLVVPIVPLQFEMWLCSWLCSVWCASPTN